MIEIHHHNKDLLDDAWHAYIDELKKIKNYDMYDRVSIHRAFPEADRAFRAYCTLSQLLRKRDDRSED